MQLYNFIPYKLSVLSNKISKGIAKFYKDQYGINISEWRVLVILSASKHNTAKELIILSQMDKVRVSRTMKSLLVKGLIIEKICKTDGRARRYNLTSNGRKLINEVTPKAIAFEKKLLAQLNAKEIKKFQNTIDILNKQVDEISSK
ncbi:MAG: MarR family winged helix-turn-helix transcriptional regulator [Proteobacteria bacterium]|nr:MarR family winged helix-turn-helix transcriptional regulator [Pseudomonadota bacterium]